MTNQRIRNITPAIPYIFLHGIDEEAVSSTPTALAWGHVDIKTNEFHYEENDDKVTIKRGGTGIYEITVSLCVEKVTGTPTHSIIELYVNGIAVDCGITHGYMGGAEQHSNAILIYTIYLNENDYVQTYVSQDAGTGKIESGTGRFRMKMLSMEGWDNKSGGTRITKGSWL